MLRLTIDGKDVEMYDNDPVVLNYQFQDFQEINSSKSNYSQTFRVPLTKANQDIFGAIQDVSVITGTFDVKKKIDASLSDDGIPLMNGYVQVKSFVQTAGKWMDVELVFFGETANLSKSIGDKMLREFDFSAYNTTLNPTNIEATWTTGYKAVRFGVVDRGQNWSGADTFTTTNTDLDAHEVTGFMHLRAICETIFEESGLELTSNFLTSKLREGYLMCNSGGQLSKFVNEAQDLRFHVGLSGSIGISTTSWTTFNFAETGAFFDGGNNVSAGVFTAPYLGNYQFKVRVKVQTPPASANLQVALFRNGSLYQYVLDLPPAQINTTASYQLFTNFFTLNPSDTIDIRYRLAGTDTATIEGTGQLVSPTTSFELYDVQLAGSVWDATQNLPEMKAIDFLNGIQKMFNLVFVPDKYIPNMFHVEPLTDYVATGRQKDFTNKIDTSKDIKIVPTTDLQARKYLWTYREGLDFLGQAVKEQLSRAYGEFIVNDPDNDFAVGEKRIEVPFASYTTSMIPETDFPILRLLQTNGEPITNPQPRIAFFTGTRSVLWILGGTQKTKFPIFSDISTDGITIATQDLNFGWERKFRSIIANPLQTLYFKYWHPFVGSLYSSDARIMEAFFHLTTAEVADMDWSDVIFIQNNLWRPLEINYTANDESALVRMKLLKIVSPFRLCVHIPSAIQKTGQVYFDNAAGTTLTQTTRECCELFGHRFEESTAFCWGNLPLS